MVLSRSNSVSNFGAPSSVSRRGSNAVSRSLTAAPSVGSMSPKGASVKLPNLQGGPADSPKSGVGRLAGLSGAGKKKSDSPRSKDGGRKLLEMLQEEPVDDAKAYKFLCAGHVSVNVQEPSFGWSALLFVAAGGHLKLVRAFLQAGADMGAKCNLGNTALHMAARAGHMQVVELLAVNSASLEAQNANGWTPLAWSSMAGHEAVTSWLLDVGAVPTAADKRGRGPIMWAARHGHQEVIRLFIKRGLDLTLVDNDGFTVIQHAEEQQDLHAMLAAVQQAKERLLEAAIRDDVAAAEGVIVDAPGVVRGGQSDETPLQWAIINGSVDMARLLVSHGASVEAESAAMAAGGHAQLAEEISAEVGRILGANTKLVTTARAQEWDAATEALQDGAWVDQPEQATSRTALHWAAIHGCAPMVVRLANSGADLEARDADGWTAVHCATHNRRAEAASVLHFLGACFSTRTLQGDTVAHLAARADSGPVIQLLHAARCDLGEADAVGRVPLQIAAEGGCTSAVRALLAFKADLAVRDPQERSVFALAVVAGHAATVKAMLGPMAWPSHAWGEEGLADVAACLPRVQVEAPPLVRPEPDPEEGDEKGPRSGKRTKPKRAPKARSGGGSKETRESSKSGKEGSEVASVADTSLTSEALEGYTADAADEELPLEEGGDAAAKPSDERPPTAESVADRASAEAAGELTPEAAGEDAPRAVTPDLTQMEAVMDQAPQAPLERASSSRGSRRLSNLTVVTESEAEVASVSEESQAPAASTTASTRKKMKTAARKVSIASAVASTLVEVPDIPDEEKDYTYLDSTPMALLYWALTARQRVPEGKEIKTATPETLLGAVDCDGRNALSLAVCNGRRHLVPLLLAHKARVDSVDAGMNTALMLAAQAGEPVAVEHLLGAGASAGLRNQEGRSAADLARDRRVQRLIQTCSDWQEIDKKLGSSESLPVLADAMADIEAADRPRFRLRIECLPKGTESEVLEDNIRLMLKNRGNLEPDGVRVALDPITQLSRGHAFLDFAEGSKARLAAKLDGRHLLGCTMRVIQEVPLA